MTYNKYITQGIIDGSIKRKDVGGIPVYNIRKPKKGEVVIGYINLSGFADNETATTRARERRT